MASGEENELSKAQRRLYLNHRAMYDTTPMFPPKPLPCGIKLVTASDIMDSIEALRKAHTADMVVTALSTDSDLSLTVSKSRMKQHDSIILDSMRMYDE